MSHTNSTTNYALPQFLTSDKPAWLTDVNNAFSDIDTAIYAAKSKADTAFTDAGNAQTDATTAINNAAAADAKGSGALASIEANFDSTTIYSVGAKVIYNSLLYRCIVAVVTPGPWTGSDNWERINVDTLISTVDSKVGQLSSLSTTDKSSVVNAVNEVSGNVNSATTKTSGTITAEAGCTIRLGSLVKINGVVYGAIAINMTTPISSRTTIGNIPAGFRPGDNVSFIAPASSAINSYQDRITNVIITPGGNIIAGDIFVPAGQSIKEVILTFAYNQSN